MTEPIACVICGQVAPAGRKTCRPACENELRSRSRRKLTGRHGREKPAVKRVMDLLKTGMRQCEIAKLLRVSKQRVSEIVRSQKLP